MNRTNVSKPLLQVFVVNRLNVIDVKFFTILKGNRVGIDFDRRTTGFTTLNSRVPGKGLGQRRVKLDPSRFTFGCRGQFIGNRRKLAQSLRHLLIVSDKSVAGTFGLINLADRLAPRLS